MLYPSSNWVRRWVMAILLTGGLPSAGVADDLLNPSSYTPIASSLTESGSYTINTSGPGGPTPTMTLPDGTVLNGVLDSSGQTAVFTFGSINLQNVNFTVTGTSALALLSQGNLSIVNPSAGLVMDLSGSLNPNYGSPYVVPGPGALTTGVGVGGSNLAGGGAGHGGPGQASGSSVAYSFVGPSPVSYSPAPGGAAYGISTPQLLGGSSGGNGFGFGGGGGGAVELGATGNITFSGTIRANAGPTGPSLPVGFVPSVGAGGGSGGEIAFLGNSVSITHSFLSVNGSAGMGGGPAEVGYSGSTIYYVGNGGNGAGGVIEVDAKSLTVQDSTASLLAGDGTPSGALLGFGGVSMTGFAVPEPSSLVMTTIALVFGGCLAWKRRQGPSKKAA